MRSPALLLVLLLTGLLASPAASAPIHPLADQDPVAAGFSRGARFGRWTRGWHFRVNAAGVSVSELGMRAASSGDFVISLWDVAAGAIVAQTALTHTAGAWQWSALSSAVALTQGADYIVALHAPRRARYFWAQQSTVGSSWFPTGAIEYLDTRYCNRCTAGTLPASALAGYQYGLVDIGYSVPETATAVLLILGLTGLAWQGRVPAHRRRGTKEA